MKSAHQDHLVKIRLFLVVISNYKEIGKKKKRINETTIKNDIDCDVNDNFCLFTWAELLYGKEFTEV